MAQKVDSLWKFRKGFRLSVRIPALVKFIQVHKTHEEKNSIVLGTFSQTLVGRKWRGCYVVNMKLCLHHLTLSLSHRAILIFGGLSHVLNIVLI